MFVACQISICFLKNIFSVVNFCCMLNHRILLLYIQGISHWSVKSKSAVRGRRFHNCFNLWCLSPKNLLNLMVVSHQAPKWPIPVPFCQTDHQKFNFYWYLITFLSEAVEASFCYFFGNWVMKLKFPNLLNPLGIII